MDNSTTPGSETFKLSSWIFLRLLGLCLLAAFVSFKQQELGLIGSDGILPIGPNLSFSWAKDGIWAILSRPTLFWFDAGDSFLMLLSACGIAMSTLVLFGIFTGPALIVSFICYLSLVNVGGPFYQFQWDFMLLESTLLAIFLVRWQRLEPPWRRVQYNYSNLILWLVRWLYFRVMFCSGVAKLSSGCPSWLDLSALKYYYQDQLLPTPLAWYAHQLPDWAQLLSTIAVLVIELLLPFCIWAPRKIRIWCGCVLIFLQLAFILTGNHGFINLLTVALGVTLLDDQTLGKICPPAFLKRFNKEPASAQTEQPQLSGKAVKLKRTFATIGISVLVLASVFETLSVIAGPHPPKFFSNFTHLSAAYGLGGRYGLYPWVFKERTEILVEASDDLVNWKSYQFQYKIDDVNRAPPVVVLLQPRLDWRMRFAALKTPETTFWFRQFVQKLLSGSTAVRALLAGDSFASKPPNYIRANLYKFEFTTYTEKSETHAWWKRTFIRKFLEPISLN